MIIKGQASYVNSMSIKISAGLLVPESLRATKNSCVTTCRERLDNGNVLVKHKDIDKDDYPLYRMAVTDCLR